MPRFCIVNENTEDTLDDADNLEDAIRLARKAATKGAAGEAVSVLESGGKAVRQFVLLQSGVVAEQVVASVGKVSARR